MIKKMGWGGFLLGGVWFLAMPVFSAQGYSIDLFAAFAKKAANSMDGAQQNFETAQGAVTGAQAISSTPQDPSYAAMNQPLTEMKAALDVLSADAAAISQTENQIMALYGTDKTIDTNDPRVKQLQDLMKTLQKDGGTFQGHGGAFNSANHKLMDASRHYGIGGEKVKDIMDPLVKRMAKRQAGLVQLRAMVRQAKGLTLEGEKADLVTKMEDRLEKTEAAWKDCRGLFAQFQTQTKGNEFVYSGPGIPPVTLPGEINKQLDHMHDLDKKAKSEWKKIKPKETMDDPDSEN